MEPGSIVRVPMADFVRGHCQAFHRGCPSTVFGTLATARGVSPCTAAAATSPPAGAKSTKTRPGNPDLKAALGTAALSIANSHGTYLAAKYRRIAARGPIKPSSRSSTPS